MLSTLMRLWGCSVDRAEHILGQLYGARIA